MKRPQGYILIMSIMIIAASMTLVTLITSRSSVFTPYARIVVDREKASMLAFGGVQIALSQLGAKPQKEGNTQESADAAKKTDTPDNNYRAFLQRIMPIKNQWQTFTLTRAKEGVDGTIRVCIVCEQGKIDINQIYDFKAKKFVGEGQPTGDMKKTMQELFSRVQQQMGGAELFGPFETFLRSRAEPLIDVTELLLIKEFSVFKDSLFFDPTAAAQKNNDNKPPLFLTDIFTVSSEKKQLNPWLFSQSLCLLWGLDTTPNSQDDKSALQEALKKFKQMSDWKTDWDSILAPLYKKQAKDVSALVPALLESSFQATTFSVLSYGKIGKVTQKLLAIIAGENDDKGNFQQLTIKKIYWL